jgi:hypothetical protein
MVGGLRRVGVLQVVSKAKHDRIIQYMGRALDTAYPIHAPWRVWLRDPDIDNPEPFHIVTNDEENEECSPEERRRAHVDGHGPRHQISLILLMTDTCVSWVGGQLNPNPYQLLLSREKRPPTNKALLGICRKWGRQLSTATQVAQTSETAVARAGSIVVIEQGSRIHAGGRAPAGDSRCTLTGSSTRVVAYTQACPESVYEVWHRSPRCTSEYPLGLLAEPKPSDFRAVLACRRG